MPKAKTTLIIAFFFGILLRFWYPGEIEYKWDEYYMFMLSQFHDPVSGWQFTSLPSLGMPSGVLLRNPGLSVWIFIACAKIFHITTPIGLSQFVVATNLLACAAMALLVKNFKNAAHRNSGYWVIALILVNPIAIIYHRKIWGQCVLPIFCVAHLYFWLHRDKKWGAYFWGLLGVALGQIHMSGFFFGLGFTLWTFTFDKNSRRQLGAFLFGGLTGLIPLLPWIHYLFTKGASDNVAHLAFLEPLRFKFLCYFLGDPLGIHLATFLGRDHFINYLSGPKISSTRTYLNAFLHLMLIYWILGLLKNLHFKLKKSKRQLGFKIFNNIKNELLHLMDSKYFKGQSTSLVGATCAAFFGYCILISISTVGIFRHYLIITFPFEWIFLVLLVSQLSTNPDRKLFQIFCVQLLISMSFFGYIHVHHGAEGGDYGIAYQYQTEASSKEMLRTLKIINQKKP